MAAAMALALAGCGGGGGGDSPDVPGTYRHPVEGVISLSEDGTGTVDDGAVPITWTVDGDTVTITAGDDEIEANLRDGDLVFPPGAYSCCDDTEAVFERE